MKESYEEDDDGYNLTYYESKRGTQNRIINIEGQISNLRRGLSDALKMLKCLILTLVCAVVIIVSLLTAIILMASFSSNAIPEVIEENTGSSNISTSTNCFLEVNGELKKSMILTDTSEIFKISVHGSGLCKLRFLAVGGGGKGYFSGGGSGYVIYGKTTITPDLYGETSIIADGGDQREASTISINGDVKRAESGKDRKDGDQEKNRGGDGYSGGGDNSGSSYGGSNGANGGGEDGGKGTGEDISKYEFNTWHLSPGEGGKFWAGCSGDPCGGGGGGVLVGGVGPNATKYQGQGFGGGGSGSTSSQTGGTYGLQGVILLELH